jgi:peptidoglycan/LPS O-acetylase OafA/YrhL
VAVLPVLLYHAGFPGFGGGFVGVDVFFVVSGYLITSIVLDELDAGRFSLVAFYERRVRRIFPALFVVLLVSLALGPLLLLPGDLTNLGQSADAAAASASNILFWHEAGYFDAEADRKPLLHTWSLAVEEQFYLALPLALLLLHRAGGTRLRDYTAACCSRSCSRSGASSTRRRRRSTRPRRRAWELLLGSLLAMGVVPPPGRQGARDALSLAGLGLIAVGVFAYSAGTPFPGAAALPPCLGAALVIHAGVGGRSLAGRFLSARPLVLTGLISYSLYLWHWPLLVFARSLAGRGLTWAETLAVLALSVAVAAASWRWIERPFRGRRPLLSRAPLFAAAGLAIGTVMALGSGLHFARGLPDRLPPEAARLAEGAADRSQGRGRCVGRIPDATRHDDPCRLGATGQQAAASFLLWGDSHAGALAGVAAARSAAPDRRPSSRAARRSPA